MSDNLIYKHDIIEIRRISDVQVEKSYMYSKNIQESLEKYKDSIRENLHLWISNQRKIFEQTKNHAYIIQMDTISIDSSFDARFIMEWIPYDLQYVIHENNKLTRNDKRHITKCLIEAVLYLESIKLSHLDIKPGNILVTPDYKTVKLCDFDHAEYWGSYVQSCVITRWYRPPDFLLGSAKHSNKADVWSLGCTIYEIFKSEVLFPGRDHRDQLNKILYSQPTLWNNLDIVSKILIIDPVKRPLISSIKDQIKI